MPMGTWREILGPSLVEHDRMQRVLEIGRQAQRIYAGLPAETASAWTTMRAG